MSITAGPKSTRNANNSMILNEAGRLATAGTPGVVDTSGNFSNTGVV